MFNKRETQRKRKQLNNYRKTVIVIKGVVPAGNSRRTVYNKHTQFTFNTYNVEGMTLVATDAQHCRREAVRFFAPTDVTT